MFMYPSCRWRMNTSTRVTGYEKADSSAPNILPFHSRPTEPPHAGLRSIRPAKKRVDKLMSYISYQLMINYDTRSSKATAEVTMHIESLNQTMKNHTFDGTDPIRIFDYLTSFVNEVCMLKRSEAQTFIALPKFLADPPETQFRTNLSGASRHGGISCWSAAIQ